MSSWPFGVLLEQVRLARLKFPEPTVGVPDSLAADALPRRALAVAYAEVGNGELGGNNRGPHVARYCAPHGDGHLWCAGFVGFGFAVAADQEGVELPFRRSLRARTLFDNIAAVGRSFSDYRDAEPGDVGLVGRGLGGNHIFFIARVAGASVVTVEGNHGPRVCEHRRFPERERMRFASLRR